MAAQTRGSRRHGTDRLLWVWGCSLRLLPRGNLGPSRNQEETRQIWLLIAALAPHAQGENLLEGTQAGGDIQLGLGQRPHHGCCPKEGDTCTYSTYGQHMQKHSIICPSVFLATSPHLKVGGSRQRLWLGAEGLVLLPLMVFSGQEKKRAHAGVSSSPTRADHTHFFPSPCSP